MSLKRWSRFAFNIVAWLFAAAAAIQVYAAGLAVFGDGNWGLHFIFGALIGLLTLVLIAFALLGRLPGRLIGASFVPLLLFIVQSALVGMRTDAPVVAALHPLNGFVILFVGLAIAWRTRGYLRAPTVTESAASGLDQPVATEEPRAD